MDAILSGIRAIELGAFGNGPIIGVILGDLGAEVIKIEDRIAGDPARGITALYGLNVVTEGGHNLIFESTNRNKKSITLDLNKKTGQEIACRLVEKSDVFYSNYRRRSLKKMCMDYETLSHYNPVLVYAVASGFGKHGADSNKRAFDPLGLARSGIMMASGEREGPPGYVTGAVGDTLGATMAAFGIVTGILARERTGKGQEIDTSLLGSCIWAQFTGVALALSRGRPIARHQRGKAKNPLVNCYKCKDEQWIMIGEPQSDRYWGHFCRIMHLEPLINDPRFTDAEKRHDNCEELVKILDDIFIDRTRSEWLDYFNTGNAEFAYEGIYDVTELADDPQVQANNYIIDNRHPALGHIKMVQLPLDFSKMPIKQEKKPAPQFGQHTEEILLDLGYTWEDISRFKDEEII